MRTRAPQRRTTFTRLLLALVLGLTQMGTALHFALVRHAIASDGALVHASKEATTAAPDTVSAGVTVTQRAGSACAVAALQRTPVEAPAPVLVPTPTHMGRPAPTPLVARVCDSSGTYRLAPKSSPPV